MDNSSVLYIQHARSRMVAVNGMISDYRGPAVANLSAMDGSDQAWRMVWGITLDYNWSSGPYGTLGMTGYKMVGLQRST